MSKESQTNYLDKMELPKSIEEKIESVARSKRLNKEQKMRLEDEVKKRYVLMRFEPGEVVGILAAQSISEPATQMSLDGKEKIIIKHNDAVNIQKIGEFVDGAIERFGGISENGWDILDISNLGIYVPSINHEEKMEWKKVLACSRHKAPEKLLRLKTLSGREIFATDSHSFVTRKDNKIIAVAGKNLKEGERISSLKFLPENCIDYINIKALAEVEFSRAKKPLPEILPLDYNTGWIFGAYISEGNCTPNFVSISNTEDVFLERMRQFASTFGLTYNEYDNFRGFAKGHDIHINSTLLSAILARTCGNGSQNKKIPNFAYSANEEFVKGLLQGYFEGDGNISVKRGVIRASSNSKELIDGLAMLLTRFSIFSYKGGGKQFTLSIPAKYASIFREKIGFVSTKKSQELDRLCKKSTKQDFIELVSGFGKLFVETAKKLGYPTRYVNSFTKRQKIGKETLLRYITLFSNIAKERGIEINEELKIMKIMHAADVVWDEIVSLEYVAPSSEYVYDLTVEGTETFTTFEGIVTHNTMRTYHFAGSAGIKVTYGLPRLIEIFDAKKELETPVMTIYLKKKADNQNVAKDIAEEIVEKRLLNIIKKVLLNLNENTIEIELADMRKIERVIKVLKESFPELNIKEKAKKIVVSSKGEVNMKELEKIKESVLRMHISGIKGISNAVVRKEGEEWLINTIGSNLEEVLKIDEVDGTKTVSNDIYEMEKIFGIEAARNLIISESIKTLQEQGLDVDVRHVMLLADLMTLTGDIRSIGRYGVAGTKTSILARAAFEETIKHLVKASIRNEVDNFKGIFENVMVGQVIPSGTGMFDLIAQTSEEEK